MKFITDSVNVSAVNTNQKTALGLSLANLTRAPLTAGERATTEQVITSALYGRSMTNGRSVRCCLSCWTYFSHPNPLSSLHTSLAIKEAILRILNRFSVK